MARDFGPTEEPAVTLKSFNALNKVRVAVVQLECHPAFTIGHGDWLSEPFYSKEMQCLAHLADYGYTGVDELQSICRDRYIRWAEIRLKSVLRWFENRFPSSQNLELDWPDMPDIIVFPEGSVPLQHLHHLVDFARKTRTIVFAGTHSLEISENALSIYNRLGIVLHDDDGEPQQVVNDIKTADRLYLENQPTKNKQNKHRLGDGVHPYTRQEINRILKKRIASLSVLPVICPEQETVGEDIVRRNVFREEFGSGENGKSEARKYLGHSHAEELYSQTELVQRPCLVRLRAKTTLSVFERTDGGGDESADPPRVIRVQLPRRRIRGGEGGEVRILPMVCAEALNYLSEPLKHGRYDLLVVPSFNADYGYFDTIVRFHTQKQIPVAYCNDGRFGNSTISFIPDQRQSAVFFSETHSGRLPAGSDGILVADVTPGFGGRQQGITNPRQFYQLIALSAVIHNNPQNPPSHASRVLNAARELMTQFPNQSKPWPNDTDPFRFHSEVLKRLEQVAKENAPTPIQKVNLQHLIRLASDPSNAFPYEWTNHAWDCLVDRTDAGLNESQMSYDEQSSFLLRPLRDLDSDLAALCYLRIGRWFDHLGDRGRRDEMDEARASALYKVRVDCRARMGNGADRVLAHLEKIKDDARAKSKEKLHHLVGAFVERYGANSAWLCPIGHDENTFLGIDLFITHNTTARHRSKLNPANGQARGIINHVRKTKQAYLVNAIHSSMGSEIDPFYEEFMFTTRSELTVPVFDNCITAPTDPDDKAALSTPKLLAVLNLESIQVGAFHAASVGEIQAAVAELVPELLIYFAATDFDNLTAWHPGIHNWGSGNLVDQFCYAVATAFGRSGEPSLTCTLWNYDHSKEILHARGTVGFDYEYLARTSLPMSSFTGQVVKQMNLSQQSFPDKTTKEKTDSNEDLAALAGQMKQFIPNDVREKILSEVCGGDFDLRHPFKQFLSPNKISNIIQILDSENLLGPILSILKDRTLLNSFLDQTESLGLREYFISLVKSARAEPHLEAGMREAIDNWTQRLARTKVEESLRLLRRRGPRVYRVNLPSTDTKPKDEEVAWRNVARKRKIQRMGITELIIAPLIGQNANGIRAEGTINLYVYNYTLNPGNSQYSLLSEDELVFPAFRIGKPYSIRFLSPSAPRSRWPQ